MANDTVPSSSCVSLCRWQDPSQCTNVCPRLTTHSCPSMTWSLGDGAVIEQELCWNSDRCQTSKYQSVSQCLWYNYKNNSDNNKTDLFSGHDSPGEPAGTTTLRNIFRVTTCMENREMSGILTAVSEMSDVLLKVGEVSGKILSGKSGLKLFIVSCMVMVVMVNA